MHIFSHFPKTVVKTICLLMLLVAGLLPQTVAAQRVRIETTVEDFKTTQFLIGCPSSNGDAAFVMDIMKTTMTIDEANRFIDLLDAFESKNGVKINARTQTLDFSTAFDNIRTISRGPLDKNGKSLCDFLKTLQK